MSSSPNKRWTKDDLKVGLMIAVLVFIVLAVGLWSGGYGPRYW